MARDLGRTGGPRDFECRSYPLETSAGGHKEAVEHIRDVTEQKRADDRRRVLEAQRKVDGAIRVVGGLAAGAAHDFNTLLTVIKGYAQFLLEATPGGDPRHSDAQRIYSTAERGGRLVRELMALGGADLTEPQPVNVASLVDGMVPAVCSLMGDEVVLDFQIAPGPLFVLADSVHLERLILNLLVNARDAMVSGGGRLPKGTLTLEISNVEVDGTSPAMAIEGMTPGHYVMLVVSDTGCGMAPEVQSRVFEPFFTTKPPGTGTGLGLATVAWIVRRYNGRIACESAAGRGTTFVIYLPRDAKA
jgi:signal transduction histidine kinase